AILRSMGAAVGAEELLVTSGAAFTFVYDNAPVYEPLRDLVPEDTVRTGAGSAGYSGRWLADVPPGEALEHLAVCLGAGRPALVSLYAVEGHHGFAVATGYEPDEGYLLVQTGERDFQPGMAPTVIRIPLSGAWSGAITGPMGWGQCPFFLPDTSRSAGWSPEGRLYRALMRGAALIRGGTVPYRDCEGAREFSRVPLAGRQAHYGLPAFDLLAADLSSVEWLGGFALIWRLDAQLGQLGHHRHAAAGFLRTVAHPLAGEAADLCRQTADLAADLASRYWFRPSREATSAADVMSLAGSRPAMIYWLNLSDEEQVRLASRMCVVPTAWGPVAIVDSAPRRRDAVALVSRMRQQEERLANVLTRLAEGL
ncbi:MAG TPA: hypothetical protein VD902_04190, partial [Symbiobacteriaceae bacterium]|nr:hypothetical protein [Symbiobacteriaceae bacterium]